MALKTGGQHAEGPDTISAQSLREEKVTFDGAMIATLSFPIPSSNFYQKALPSS